MRVVKTAILSAIFLSAFHFLTAQSIVHIENSRLGETENGLKGNIELGVSFIQNINDIFQTNNLSQFQYKKDKSSWMSLNGFNLTVFNSRRIVNDGFQHFRYSYKTGKVVSPEVFTQIQFNEIIKVQSRFLNGIGGRWSVLEKDSVRLYIGTLYMYEREQETTGILNLHHRFNFYTSFGFPISKNFTLDFIGYYQPEIAYLNDFRASSEVTLDMKLTKRLSFRLSGSWLHDTRPPEGIRNTFYNFKNTFLYTFE